MGEFIKIIDEEIARVIIASGFSYMKEKQNNKDVYVFPLDSKLLLLLQTAYSDEGFVCENKLRF